MTPEPFAVYRNGGGNSRADVLEAVERVGLRAVDYDRSEVAGVLAAGGVVALAQGAAELGPRALGHRSLLGSPSVPGMRERMSEKLKQREWYRPLGAVLRDERFTALYPGQAPSPYMSVAMAT